MHSRLIALSLAAATIAAAACGSDSTSPKSNVVKLTATLTPAGEVGATLAGTTTASTGTFNGTLDTVTNAFNYTVTYAGLSSNVTLGHIHGPFTVGQTTGNSAGVILNFDPTAANTPLPSSATFAKGATSGTAAGSVTLSSAVAISTTVNGDSLKKLLLAGKSYANVHTSLNGGGEVRGQITVTP
ncbi:MAG TPA: CHRD domain-containing protein [Gemmatimonadaceae bacterium]|jgi:hypothetical protein